MKFRIRFSIRFALLLLVLFGLAFAWIRWQIEKVAVRESLLQKVQACGGSFGSGSPPRGWSEYFADVVLGDHSWQTTWISLSNSSADAALVRQFEAFKYLEGLDLGGLRIDVASDIPKNLPLRHLDLSNTQLNNEDVAQLKCFPLLETLSLSNTAVDNGCLESLVRFRNLKGIATDGTAIAIAATIEVYERRGVPPPGLISPGLSADGPIASIRMGNGPEQAGFLIHQARLATVPQQITLAKKAQSSVQPEVRIRALKLTNAFDDATTVTLVANGLKDADLDVVEAAVACLSNRRHLVANAEITDCLISGPLKNRDPQFQSLAIEALFLNDQIPSAETRRRLRESQPHLAPELSKDLDALLADFPP